ncbi:MAG: NUDIX domain-containing protein [Arcobacteraceae bacterium]
MEKVKAFGICLYKKRKNLVKVLLCKSVNSKERWGFLKGVSLKDENEAQTALREFYEESSIKVESKNLEVLFTQKNELKNIGIYLVNYDNVKEIEKYFNDEKLYKTYLSHENSDVEFFDIKKLPLIKKKQKYLTQDILKYLNSKYT